MHTKELKDNFRRMYTKCSENEIGDLVSAIISAKYWKVHSERKDYVYVVALSQAKIPLKDGFRAKSNAIEKIIVSKEAAKFCRRGRVLTVKKSNGDFKSNTVIEWPTFIKIIREDQDFIYKLIFESPNPPPFINRRMFIMLMDKLKKK